MSMSVFEASLLSNRNMHAYPAFLLRYRIKRIVTTRHIGREEKG